MNEQELVIFPNRHLAFRLSLSELRWTQYGSQVSLDTQQGDPPGCRSACPLPICLESWQKCDEEHLQRRRFQGDTLNFPIPVASMWLLQGFLLVSTDQSPKEAGSLII